MNLKQTELLAMLRKQPDAYGVSIYEELEKRLKSGADSMAAATSGAVAVDFAGTETTASALARHRLSLGRGLCVLALALVFLILAREAPCHC
jgi:hypothetical protein